MKNTILKDGTILEVTNLDRGSAFGKAETRYEVKEGTITCGMGGKYIAQFKKGNEGCLIKTWTKFKIVS